MQVEARGHKEYGASEIGFGMLPPSCLRDGGHPVRSHRGGMEADTYQASTWDQCVNCHPPTLQVTVQETPPIRFKAVRSCKPSKVYGIGPCPLPIGMVKFLGSKLQIFGDQICPAKSSMTEICLTWWGCSGVKWNSLSLCESEKIGFFIARTDHSLWFPYISSHVARGQILGDL